MPTAGVQGKSCQPATGEPNPSHSHKWHLPTRLPKTWSYLQTLQPAPRLHLVGVEINHAHRVPKVVLLGKLACVEVRTLAARGLLRLTAQQGTCVRQTCQKRDREDLRDVAAWACLTKERFLARVVHRRTGVMSADLGTDPQEAEHGSRQKSFPLAWIGSWLGCLNSMKT